MDVTRREGIGRCAAGAVDARQEGIGRYVERGLEGVPLQVT